MKECCILIILGVWNAFSVLAWVGKWKKYSALYKYKYCIKKETDVTQVVSAKCTSIKKLYYVVQPSSSGFYYNICYFSIYHISGSLSMTNELISFSWLGQSIYLLLDRTIFHVLFLYKKSFKVQVSFKCRRYSSSFCWCIKEQNM